MQNTPRCYCETLAPCSPNALLGYNRCAVMHAALAAACNSRALMCANLPAREAAAKSADSRGCTQSRPGLCTGFSHRAEAPPKKRGRAS